jgi:hypothetical protein
VPLALETVDITSDARLQERYGNVIPVIAVDGVEVAVSFIHERELRECIERAALVGSG